MHLSLQCWPLTFFLFLKRPLQEAALQTSPACLSNKIQQQMILSMAPTRLKSTEGVRERRVRRDEETKGEGEEEGSRGDKNSKEGERGDIS